MAFALRSYWKIYGTYIEKPFLKFFFVGFLLLSQSLFLVLNPQILGLYIDYVLSGEPLPFGSPVLLIVIFIVLTSTVLILGTSLTWLTEKIGWEATNKLRNEMLENILLQGREFFVENKAGEVIERVDGDVVALSDFFSKFMSSIIANGLLLSFIIIILGTIHWAFSFAFFLLVLGTVGISNEGRKRIMSFFLKEREASAKLYGVHEELLSARADLLGNGETNYPIQKASIVEAEKFSASLRTQLVARLFNITISLAVAMGSILPYLVGLPLFTSYQISISDIFLVSYYATMIFLPTFEIVRQIDALQRAEASMIRIFQLLNKIEVDSTLEKPIPPEIGEIKFENVTFQYSEKDNFRLKDVCADFRKGRINGLVGRTGSGKTTLLRLLLRYYESYIGKITVNGEEIRSIKKDNFQKSFFWVSQTGGLFPGTILENLTFFEENPNVERIIHLLKKFNFWENLAKCEYDLNCDIADLMLSEGQKQLFEIIRAAYFDPPILILDEATSSTDEKVTEQILDYLNEIKMTRLIIFIAHQAKTIQKLDFIIHLHNGLVSFKGTPSKWNGFIKEVAF